MPTNEMNEELWRFVDGCGDWARQFGMTRMAGRVLGWLLVCEPAEQTAAQLAEAMQASKGSISGATGMLVRAGLADRLHIRGERGDRFRLRPQAWDEQMGDQGTAQARQLIAVGLQALQETSPSRRARLEELDAFYAFWQTRVEDMVAEWQAYKRARFGGGGDDV